MLIFERNVIKQEIGYNKHLLIIPVVGLPLEVQSIGFDGESIVGYSFNVADHKIAETLQLAIDGNHNEWSTHDWSQMMKYIGVKETIELHTMFRKYWQPFNDFYRRENVVSSLEYLIKMVGDASLLASHWHEELNDGYPFDKDFDELLLAMFDWQHRVIANIEK